MMTETISGLHSCKPANVPVAGDIKTFVIEHRPAKNGKKAWIKIKSATPEYGGTPYRILEAKPTGFTDQHGNIGFNLEIETAVDGGGERETSSVPTRQKPISGFSAAGRDDPPPSSSNGVDETRKHIMQAVNLYNLCVDAVDKCIKPRIENMDGELYQAAIGTLFIEASHKRTFDGVNWFSYVDKMPTHPIR